MPGAKSMNRFAAMEAFVRVIETGSFSSAARQLQVGQPAISKLIAQLEDRLGVRLLLRSTHGLTPTEAGQSFYARAKRSLEEADEADLAARGAAATLSGRLRISAAVTFAQLHIVPKLPIFLAQHPKLDVDVVLDDRNIDLVGERIDVALRMGTLTDPTLTVRRLASCRRLVLGSPAYLARAGEPSTPGELVAHESVIYDRGGGGSVWTFRQGAVETSVTVGGRVQVTAAEGVRAAVCAGLGLAIASEWMFEPELRQGTVRAVLLDWKLPPIDLWAVFPSGRRASAKARAFISFVQGQLATMGLSPSESNAAIEL
jgi:DNA-binding transcriptional LysR family regulator